LASDLSVNRIVVIRIARQIQIT